ncbi:hypothetical protein [uncultured Sulfitobacter sp.]|uniref:hypothetical protein n=1 Tax=uncultured Sulfitobacter sp. TaxID=191468 RepID=UPI00262405ED|nr:hypothetical protein [uncultured Sulfitobacter sp.]
MEWIFAIIVAFAVIGVAIALFERKNKRNLLKHDLNLQARRDPHTNAAQIQAEHATIHRISGFDR